MGRAKILLKYMQNFDFTRNGGTEVKDNNYTQEMFLALIHISLIQNI